MKNFVEGGDRPRNQRQPEDTEGWVADEIRLSSLYAGLLDNPRHRGLANISIPLRVWTNRHKGQTTRTVDPISHGLAH